MEKRVNFGIVDMSVKHLDWLVYHNGGIVGQLDGTEKQKRDFLPDRLIGGWIPRWVGTKSREDVGILILLPSDKRTTDIVYFSTLNRCKAAGMDHHTARAVAKLKMEFKIELLPIIIELLCNKNQTVNDALVFLSEPSQEYSSWLHVWSTVMPASTKGLDEVRLRALGRSLSVIQKLMEKPAYNLES